MHPAGILTTRHNRAKGIAGIVKNYYSRGALRPNYIHISQLFLYRCSVGSAYGLTIKGAVVLFWWNQSISAHGYVQIVMGIELLRTFTAIFVAGYAQVMAESHKAPATIFQSVCISVNTGKQPLLYVRAVDMPKEPEQRAASSELPRIAMDLW